MKAPSDILGRAAELVPQCRPVYDPDKGVAKVVLLPGPIHA